MPGSWYIEERDFGPFVDSLIRRTRVVGPVARKHQFVFEALTAAADLRLDYDVTLLPAKKAIFPPHQTLVSFTANSMESRLAPVDQVLLGVHLHEVRALDMLDLLFSSGHEDKNWTAYREHTTVVASGVETVHPRAFFTSLGAHLQARGHDALLTRLPSGRVYVSRTEKGDQLLTEGRFVPASPDQVEQASRIQEAVAARVPQAMPGPPDQIAARVRGSFGDQELWRDLARDCFSCGTCNLVCPTCYCFDVQDRWNPDQVSGVRERVWDGCLLEDFAQVTLGGGAKENFRAEPAARFRHRMMRKLAYLNPKLGGPACVGCGRCSAGCVPDIADPVAIVRKIMARG